MRRPKNSSLADAPRPSAWRSHESSLDGALERVFTSPGLRRAALVLSIVLIARGLAGVTWRVIAPVAPAAPAVSPLGEQRRSSTDVSSVFEARFFGDRTVPARQAAAAGEGAGLGDLGVTLLGVVAAGRDSMAILSVSGGAVETYALGSEIASGAVLERVEADRILIRRGGRLETVLLTGAPGAPASAPVSGGVTAVGPNRFAVSRQAIRAELSSPETLLQAQVESAPGGGIALSGVEPGSVYERLGLRSGTIIRSVNGQSVQTPEDLLKLYQQIGSSSEIQLDVINEGRQERLRYDVQ